MKRIRISLREMLLIIALFAVFFAWLAARRDMQRNNMRWELTGIEQWREFASNHPDIYTSEKAWHADLQELNENIAERKKTLGEPSHHR